MIEIVRSPIGFKPPTCERFEPNFMKVFGMVRSVEINGDMRSDEGFVIVSLWENQKVFGVNRRIRGVLSNAAFVPVLVKNPTERYTDLVGAKNGLTVIENIALAVRITYGGRYVTRQVTKDYQEIFIEKFRELSTYLPGLVPAGQTGFGGRLRVSIGRSPLPYLFDPI